MIRPFSFFRLSYYVNLLIHHSRHHRRSRHRHHNHRHRSRHHRRNHRHRSRHHHNHRHPTHLKTFYSSYCPNSLLPRHHKEYHIQHTDRPVPGFDEPVTQQTQSSE